MEINILLAVVIAVIMALSVGFFDALVKQVTTGIYDYGYLISLFIYSIFVGVFTGFTGLIDLNMPLENWMAVLVAVFTQYFLYLTALHAMMDYVISALFPAQPQGLATRFLKLETRMALSPHK